MLCKYDPEMKLSKRKHLSMRIFDQNKDGKSKDQNKNEFHFISTAMKTIVNRFFFMAEGNPPLNSLRRLLLFSYTLSKEMDFQPREKMVQAQRDLELSLKKRSISGVYHKKWRTRQMIIQRNISQKKMSKKQF